MKEKNLIILCIVFAILIGLVFIKKNTKPKVPTAEEVSDIISASVKSADINDISITLGKSSSAQENPKPVVLAKEGDHWVVKSQFGVYAKDKVIDSALDKLDGLEGELRSDKASVLSDYGIDDDQAVRVTLQREGADAIEVLIGTEKAGYQNNFVRFAGSNAVYVTSENLLTVFGVRDKDEAKELDENKWTDKRISHLDTSEIVGVTISQLVKGEVRQVIDIKKEDVDGKKQWKSVTPLPFGLSASKIKTLVQNFNNTYAREIVAPDVEGVFDEHTWTGVFTKENGEQVTMVRGKKDEAGSNYYLKHEGAPYYYVIPVSTFESREKQQGSIFANNPLKVDPSTIDELLVKDLVGKKEFHVVKKVDTGGTSDKEGSDGEEESTSPWKTPAGDTVEESKINDIIGKIKNISIDVDFQPAVAVDDALRIRVTKEGVSTGYTITEDLVLSNGKECRFLSVDGSKQNFCASKSQIVALQNALP